MQRVLGSKIAIIVLVSLLLAIPLNMIQDLVTERQGYHRQAIAAMAESSTSAQQMIGPVLVMPCDETVIVKAYPDRPIKRDCTTYQLPEILTVDGTVITETRSRGIPSSFSVTTSSSPTLCTKTSGVT